MADGSIRINTKLDTNEAQADLVKLEKECEKTAQKIGAAGEKIKAVFTGMSTGQLNNAFRRVNKDLEKTNAEIAELDRQISAVQADTDSMLPKATTDEQAANLLAIEETQIGEIARKRDALTAKAAEYKAQLQSITGELEKQKTKQDKYQDEVDQSTSKTKKLGKAAADAGNKASKAMKKASSGTNTFGKAITKGIKHIGKMALAVFGIRAAYNAVRRAATAYLESNQEMKQQVESLWNIAGQAIGPFIEMMIRGVSTVVAWVSTLIKTLTGVDLVAKANAAALKKQASATKEAAKAAQLAGFDEMNKLNDDSSNGGASESGAALFDTSLVGEIPSFIEKMKNQILAGDWFGAGETLGTALMDGIKSIDWKTVGFTIGETLVNAASLALGFLFSIDPVVLMGSINSFLGNLFKGISKGLQGLDWASIGGKIVELLAYNILVTVAITNPLAGILMLMLTPNGDELASGAAELIGTIIGALAKALIGAGKKVAEIGKTLFTTIKSHFDKYVDWSGTPEEIINGLLQGILAAIKGIGAWIIKNIWEPFRDGFKKAFGIASPAKKMVPFGGYIVAGIKEGIGDIWSKVKGKFTEWGSKISAWFTTAKSNFQAWGSALIAYARAGIGNIWSKVSDKFAEWGSKISGWFTTAKGNFKTWGSGLISSLGSGIGNIWSKISSKFTEAKNKLINWGDALKTNAKETGKKFVNGLKEGLDTLKTKLKEPINAMIGMIEKALNWIIGKMNKLSWKIPDWVPGIGGKKFGFNMSEIKIPRLAKGGIVNNPGRGVPVIAGEAGAEAVLPLENNTGWMDILADKINAGAQKIVIPIYLNGRKIAEEVIDLTKQRKFATNGAF